MSEFLGNSPNARLVALDNGTSAIAAYTVFSDATSGPSSVLLYNSAYFDGSGARSEATITLTGLTGVPTVGAKRMTAPNATAESGVMIGVGGAFDGNCVASGTQSLESTSVSDGQASFTLADSEALIVFLTA